MQDGAEWDEAQERFGKEFLRRIPHAADLPAINRIVEEACSIALRLKPSKMDQLMMEALVQCVQGYHEGAWRTTWAAVAYSQRKGARGRMTGLLEVTPNARLRHRLRRVHRLTQARYCT